MHDHIETIGLSEQAKETLRKASVELTPLTLEGYQVHEEIGRGTYGVVWRATRLKTGQEVAVKTLDESKGLNWDYLRRELAMLIDLEEHPHTLTILDAQLDSSPPLIVMPLAEGGSLEKAINNRGFSLRQKERWIKQMVEALDFIHSRGVIHSDLKPSNVLLSSTNDIRIADFGQARRSEQAGGLGTLGFMPPEQCEERGGNPAVSWDIYGFGATAYWMLTGEVPRYRTGSTSEGVSEYAREIKERPVEPIRRIEPEVDRELASIVENCLVPDPASRTRGFDLVREDLRRRQQRKPLLCRRPWKASYLFQVYSRWTSVRLLLVALLVLAGVLVYQWRERQENLYSSHLLKGIQANNTGRYEEAYLQWAEALNYKGDYRPLEVRMGFRPIAQVIANQSPVLDFVMLDQGRRLITAESSGLVTLWELESQKILQQWPHELGVSRLAVNEERGRLATASFDGQARVYDLKSGELLTLSGSEGDDSLAVEAIEFSQDGRYLIAADYLGNLVIHDLDQDRRVALDVVDDTYGHQPLLAPHSSKPRLASLAQAERPCIWELETGQMVEFKGGHTKAINDLAWAADHRSLLSAGEDGVVVLWDSHSGAKQAEFQHQSPVSVVLPIDAETFAAGCRDGSVRIWKFNNSQEPALKLRLRSPVLTMAVDDRSQFLAVGTGEDPDLWSEAEANGTNNLFSLSTGHQVAGPWPSEGPINKVRFQEGENRLVSLSSNGLRANSSLPVYVKLWNYPVPEKQPGDAPAPLAKKPQTEVRLPNGLKLNHGDVAINEVELHPGRNIVATAGDDWTVRLWNGRSGEPLQRPLELRGPARGVAFSGPGDLLATASQEEALGLEQRPVRVRIWDTESGLQVSPVLTCPGEFLSLEFDGPARHLTAVTTSGRYRWALTHSQEVDWEKTLARELKVKLDKRGGLVFEPLED
ncbi:MAG: WD40 repeat domain-containing serine/threonine protein kinase [Vulcanimicrobiota bacterium]